MGPSFQLQRVCSQQGGNNGDALALLAPRFLSVIDRMSVQEVVMGLNWIARAPYMSRKFWLSVGDSLTRSNKTFASVARAEERPSWLPVSSASFEKSAPRQFAPLVNTCRVDEMKGFQVSLVANAFARVNVRHPEVLDKLSGRLSKILEMESAGVSSFLGNDSEFGNSKWGWHTGSTCTVNKSHTGSGTQQGIVCVDSPAAECHTHTH